MKNWLHITCFISKTFDFCQFKINDGLRIFKTLKSKSGLRKNLSLRPFSSKKKANIQISEEMKVGHAFFSQHELSASQQTPDYIKNYYEIVRSFVLMKDQ